ncbi:uncharacterized protein J3R85_008828 [Psidium guajava]|nr:uncharacterized protein J3R85_008828 [Psidium guajava]
MRTKTLESLRATVPDTGSYDSIFVFMEKCSVIDMSPIPETCTQGQLGLLKQRLTRYVNSSSLSFLSFFVAPDTLSRNQLAFANCGKDLTNIAGRNHRVLAPFSR